MICDFIPIDKYREIFLKYAKDGIIDINRRLDQKFRYQIYRLEQVLPAIDYTIPPSRMEEHYIALVRSGSGKKTIGTYEFPIEDNLLMVVPRRVVQAGYYDIGENAGYILFFNLDLLQHMSFPRDHPANRKTPDTSFKPFTVLTNEQTNELGRIFELILREKETDHSSANQLVTLKILELMILCDRYLQIPEKKGDTRRNTDLFETLNDLIEVNFVQNRNVEFYADRLNVHPNYLNFVVKKNSGFTAKQVIDKKIIMESKYLLSHTGLSVKEVASRLGFVDPNYFSSFFKKETSRTAIEYRKNHIS